MKNSARVLCVAAVFVCFVASVQAYYPEWPQKSAVNYVTATGLRTGDLNGDGRPDVLLRTSSNRVLVMLTNSDGTLGAMTLVYTGTTICDILLADFNNDGKVDALIADSGTNSLVALPGNGDGTFGAPVVTALTMAPTELAVADFNGDHHPDVLVRSNSGAAFSIFQSDGALQFSQLSSVALTSSPYRAVVGDVDGDGKTDVVIALSNPVGLQVYFGKGDGTFDSPLSVTGASTVSSDLVLGDLNGDGYLDIVTSQYAADQVTVILNGGSGRTFAAPVSYEVRPRTDMIANPGTLAVVDATDDGKPDVVVLLENNGGVVTLPGNGDGTLASPLLTFNTNVRALQSRAVMADFTSDGRPDLIVGSAWNNSIVLLRNAPGELQLDLTAAYPTISAGQTERFTVGAHVPVNVWTAPTPQGTVTVNEGATAQGSGDLSSGWATVNASSLALGTHTLSAALPASSDYKVATSSSVSVNVVSDTTTTTLTNDHAGQTVQYGTELILTANVTSPIAGSLYGSFWLYTDGQRSANSMSGPPLTIYSNYLPPGTHSFYVTYEGNATQPPSTSNTVTQQIVKADSHVELEAPNWWGKYGQDLTRRFSISPANGGGTPGGNVHVYEGRTLLLTFYADPTHFSGGVDGDFTLPVLPVGTHFLYATYDGDSNYNPSKSAVVRFDVLPNSTLAIQAVADPVNHTVGVWGLFSGPNAGYDTFVVHRRVNSGPWSTVNQVQLYPSYTEYNPASGTVYTYYIEAFDGSHNLLATSNVDSVTLTSFTDDPLTIDSPIKALHLTELVTAVNVFRTAANLQPIVLADIAPNGTILATHLTALQNALNEARTALESGTFAFTGGTPGTAIKAQHVQDLREAIK